MAQKRISPYTRLQETGRRFFSKVVHPRKALMMTIPNARSSEKTWLSYEIFQRVVAADQLGYEVVLTVSDNDLVLKYIEKRPEYNTIPYEFK